MGFDARAKPGQSAIKKRNPSGLRFILSTGVEAGFVQSESVSYA
jgi:hypothetical protein